MKALMPRSTLLSEELRDALAEIGTKLWQGGNARSELEIALLSFADLDPGQIARVDNEIATAAGLHRDAPEPFLGKLLWPRASGAEQLVRTPGLEYLFIFHLDGRLRQAALLKITGGLPSPFLFAAVLWRLNDWAPPVREAAMCCANRSFPATSSSIAARATAGLLVVQASWGRWRDEREILYRTLARKDVAAQLAKLITNSKTGTQASTLRHALRKPVLDRHLEQIFHEASQPSVRSVALRALVEGRAEWPSGTAWQWTDKSMGLRRRVTVFDHRPLTVTTSREALIECGLNDRSPVVRRVALDGIIKYLPRTPEARALAIPLRADPSPSVRERVEFILRQT